jgi:hypothetical protein
MRKRKKSSSLSLKRNGGNANLISFRADPKLKSLLTVLKQGDESLGLLAKDLLGLLLALLEAGRREMERRARLSPDEVRQILRTIDDITIEPANALLLPAEAARRLSSDPKGQALARKLRGLSPAGAAALAVELLRMRKEEKGAGQAK